MPRFPSVQALKAAIDQANARYDALYLAHKENAAAADRSWGPTPQLPGECLELDNARERYYQELAQYPRTQLEEALVAHRATARRNRFAESGQYRARLWEASLRQAIGQILTTETVPPETPDPEVLHLSRLPSPLFRPRPTRF